MKYVVFHTHPDGLVLSQRQKDELFATGNVLDVREVRLYSMQVQFFQDITEQIMQASLAEGCEFVGWGTENRYGNCPVRMVTFESFADVHRYCEGYRPEVKERDADGRPSYTVWAHPNFRDETSPTAEVV